MEELVLSQENKPQTHRSTRQISTECGLSQSSVVQIIHRDLALRCFKKRRTQELTAQNRATRLIRAKLLLTRCTDNEVDSMWFTDKKSVHGGHSKKPAKRSCLYAPAASNKRNIAADRLFVTTVISQGSVATRLRCGGQCHSQFVVNFLMNSTMEKCRKSVSIC